MYNQTAPTAPLSGGSTKHTTSAGKQPFSPPAGSEAPRQIPLPSRELTVGVMAVATIVLTLLSVAATVWMHYQGLRFYDTFVGFFNVDDENNLPTWYSSLSLFFCSALLFVIWSAKHVERDALRKHWFGLSAIFACLSLDEMGSMHERAGQALQKLAHAGAMPHYAWAFIALPLLAVFGIAYSKFLLRIPRQHALRFCVAGAVYVSGALVMEVIDTRYSDRHGVNLVYYTMTNFEEFLEMAGVTLFARALLEYMADYPILARLQIGRGPRSQ